jgi:diguanylate cyclase (GGDEF)-like protein
MRVVDLASTLLALLALGWAAFLLFRLRDWRAAIVVTCLGAAASWFAGLTAGWLRTSAAASAAGIAPSEFGPGPLQQLAVSGLTVAALLYVHVVSHRDHLTGLANKLRFVGRVGRLLRERRRRGSGAFAVVLLDLDGFTRINATIGREQGDQLLKMLGRRLQTRTPRADLIARLGSDEFGVLVKDCPPDKLEKVAGGAVLAVTGPWEVAGRQIATTACAGAVESAPAHRSSDHVLHDADLAVARAKEQGPAHIRVFDAAMRSEATARVALEGELRQAVEQRAFVLHYQPIMCLTTGRPVGWEALARWPDARNEWAVPSRFIPALEQTDLILPFGEWVLETACRQIRDWRRQWPHAAESVMHVNLSARQLSDPGIVELIARQLDQAGIPGNALCVEITETVALENRERGSTVIAALRDLGVHVALDDFGSGYSSLGYLSQLPVGLKLDNSFASQLTFQRSNATIVRSLIQLAHSLGMSLVVEGIETAAQRRLLQRLGAQLGQGHACGMPVAAEAVVLPGPGSNKPDAPQRRVGAAT